MEHRQFVKHVGLQVTVAAILGAVIVHAQQLPDSRQASAFDPGTAVSMLTDATANESSGAPPFLGLATRLDVDRLFGTTVTSIPIEVPPGRKSVTPDLTIRYSSNAGNGMLGVGWDLQLGGIKRNTARGVPYDYSVSPPVYKDGSGFVLVFHGGTVILDTCKNTPTCTSWGASSEEVWLDAQLDRTNNQWVVTDASGMTYTYGAAREARTGKNVNSTAVTTTFGWSLTDVQDPNGNSLHVTYAAYDNQFATTGANPHSYPRRSRPSSSST